MTVRPTATSRRLHLAEVERALAQDPDSAELLFARAGLFREDDRFEEAKRDYLELLRRTPTDFGALNDFGTLVLDAGYKSAARSLFGAAVRHHPDNPRGRVNLANLLLAVGEFDEARSHFEAALRVDPDHVHAHRGLGNVLAELGDAAGARQHRDKAFANNFLIRWFSTLDTSRQHARCSAPPSGIIRTIRAGASTSPIFCSPSANSKKHAAILKPPCGSIPTMSTPIED